MEPRRCNLSVSDSLPELERYAQIKIVCKKLVQGWSNLDAEMLEITAVPGGITNTLVKVTKKECEGETVVFRIYGHDTDTIIDRDRELKARPFLSKAGFGANLIGIYNNGIVESFINGRTLEPSDIYDPEISGLVAKEVHRFHNVDVPGSKEPQLWNDIRKFLKEALRHGTDASIVEVLKNEVKTLEEASKGINAPVVFSHNDLLAGNFILENDTGKLYLIDFEYSSYSYRGFDIGNHFNEYAGFACDFHLYPTKEQQYHFFKHYLYPDDPTKASQEELDELYKEVNFFALASHLYWAAWALVQEKVSTIKFDYRKYHDGRLHEYRKQAEALRNPQLQF